MIFIEAKKSLYIIMLIKKLQMKIFKNTLNLKRPILVLFLLNSIKSTSSIDQKIESLNFKTTT